MLTINTNLSSLIAQNSLKISTNNLNLAIERMTTGYKINHAKDNAANFSIATNMDTKIGAYQVAEENAMMGLDMVNTASSTLDLISEHLQRLRDLAVQASNGTYGADSMKAINAEANARVDEIERLYSLAEYNDIALYDETRGAGCDMESLPEAGASGFIKEVQRRDTSQMKTLASVDPAADLPDGVYSISTPQELKQLADMTNNDLISEGDEFVLASDIDLSMYSSGSGWTPIGTGDLAGNIKPFNGTFDGNGHMISNLTSYGQNTITSISLFGYIEDATIKNLSVKNCNIDITTSSGGWFAAGVVGYVEDSLIENCFTTGSVKGISCVAGLVGTLYSGTILNSYSEVSITAKDNGSVNCGGLVGSAEIESNILNCYAVGNVIAGTNFYNVGGLIGVSKGTLINCYATGNVTGETCIGGFGGYLLGTVINCYSSGDVTLTGLKSTYSLARAGGLFGSANGSQIKNCTTTSKVTTTMADSYSIFNIGSALSSSGNEHNDVDVSNCLYDKSGNPDLDICSSNIASYNNFDISLSNRDKIFTLQIGTSSDETSRISIQSNLKLKGLYSIKNLGITDDSILTKIDSLIDTIFSQQTNYGSVQNRLESALDEISTQYENLVSSRSTLRDADVAEVSSEYIRQQILQQASATLLATANQSPSIALQLI